MYIIGNEKLKCTILWEIFYMENKITALYMLIYRATNIYIYIEMPEKLPAYIMA